MCSIEEAWAGQTFNGYKVQSQADLRRKYIPISNDILTRNNEMTITKKEPVSRMGNQGINTKMIRSPLQIVPSESTVNMNGFENNMMNVSFSENQMPRNNYGGLNPRPEYMSIYDNANQNEPIPSTYAPTLASRSGFGDINQAFQVSPVIERFMAQNSNYNPLLNENSNDDQLVVAKKFNSDNTEHQNKNINSNQEKLDFIQLQTSLKDILIRLESVEKALHNGATRNMCDIMLYVLVGMLFAFILYAFLRK